jgi:pimeloyl-ACP methyl ester carboxylesterase
MSMVDTVGVMIAPHLSARSHYLKRGAEAAMRILRAAVPATLLVTAAFSLGAASADARTVWLCMPGKRPDPCAPGLSTTVYSPRLRPLRVEHPKQSKHPGIDCFYVYPTVSRQPTGNANLEIGPAQRTVALAQVGRYSQYCNVYAPMYRQITLAGFGLASTTPPNPALPLSDVRAAFQTYLSTYNHGRGFVLIGHSQGATVLRQLIARDIDPAPLIRRRMVSAILLGGNVLVRRGREIDGDFRNVPACRRASQLGCVIAFSTFDEPVPGVAFFGRPPVPANGDTVLCTNPAALAGGPGLVDPIFPSSTLNSSSTAALLGVQPPQSSTVWWTAPGAYRAQCSSVNNASVLQITAIDGAPTPRPSPSPAYGLHLIDANIALGNLLTILKKQAALFGRMSR